jgi:hypothetical protein
MLITVFLSALIVLSVVLSVSMEIVTGTVKVLPVTVLVLMILGLSVSLCMYWVRQGKLSQARTWPHVMGRVTEVEVLRKSIIPTRVRIEYSYTVNDIGYTNDIFDYASPQATEGMVRAIPEFRDVSSMKDLVGKMVRVYYKPKTPYHSSISRRFEQDSRIVTIPAIVVVLSATFFLSRILIDYYEVLH